MNWESHRQLLLLRRNVWADGLVELVQTLGQRARGVAPDVSGLVVSGMKLGAGGLELCRTGHLHRLMDRLILVSRTPRAIES